MYGLYFLDYGGFFVFLWCKYKQLFLILYTFASKKFKKSMIFSVFVQKLASKLQFEPNKSQIEAMNSLGEFLFGQFNRDRIFVLRGYAGTGKTSLVGALVKVLDEARMPVQLMAPTGRAAKVFASMAGHPAYTIHKCIYRQQKFNVEMEGFELTENRRPGVLFICDEASMISTLNEGSPFGTGNLLDDLVEYVYGAQGCKLLLVGDAAQLPPVGQMRSPALDISNLQGYGLDVMTTELTEVARQQLDSGILYNATLLRNILMAGAGAQPGSEAAKQLCRLPYIYYKMYADVLRIDGYELLDCLSSSYSQQGIDDTIIITRSNARANKFNIGVRNQILDREEELSSGDRLLVVKNNYYWGKEFDQLPFIANGDVVTVNRVRSVIELYGFRFAKVAITLPDYDIDTEVIVMLDTLTVDGPNLPVNMQQKLFEEVAQDYPECRNQRDLYKAIKENPYFNALQIKYAYCVTCHKSQGGQWQDVYLDLGYINPDHLGPDFYRWLYTAFTRARKRLYLVNMSDEMSE